MNTTLAPADTASALPAAGSSTPPPPAAPEPLLGLRTVLVPTDFSLPCAAALARAVQLARRTGARLILLHVLDDSYQHRRTDREITGELKEYQLQARHMAEQELVSLANLSRAHGVAVESRFCTGHAARQITAVAAECQADLIVLSTHGRTGLRRLVLGSVAEAVVRHAPCPVLTTHTHREDVSPTPIPEVGSAGRLTEPPLHLRRIVVPTDFSKRAAEALERAEELARDAGAILTLLHVFQPPRFGFAAAGSTGFGLAGPLVESAVRQVRADVADDLRVLGEEVRARGLTVETLCLEGDTAERICAVSASVQADLLVLSTQGLTGWDRPFLGGTAERIVRQSESPVLVIRGRH